MQYHHVHRARLWAALILLPAVLLAACGSNNTAATKAAGASETTPSSVDLTGVTLRVGDLSKYGPAALKAAGEDNTPYKIEWSSFTAGPPAIEALNANAIDLSVMGDTPSIFAQVGHVNTKIVRVAHPAQDHQSYLQLLVPENSDIKTVADLKGRKVAVAKQTILQYFLIAALKKAHLTLDDIKPAFLAPLDGQAAYNNGDVDAVVLLEPLTTITKNARPSRVIADSADFFISQSVAVARGGALDNPKVAAAIGDYLQRLQRVTAWQKTHLDQWAPIYAEATKFPPALAKATIANSFQTWVPIDDAVIRIQQNQIDAFAAAGLVPKSLNAKDEFDPRFNTLIKEPSK